MIPIIGGGVSAVANKLETKTVNTMSIKLFFDNVY